MGRGYTQEVIRLLHAAGCYEVRAGKGDHAVWWSPITRRNFTVDGRIMSRHTANGTLKQAGLDKGF